MVIFNPPFKSLTIRGGSSRLDKLDTRSFGCLHDSSFNCPSLWEPSLWEPGDAMRPLLSCTLFLLLFVGEDNSEES